jgi:hypothetical protein
MRVPRKLGLAFLRVESARSVTRLCGSALSWPNVAANTIPRVHLRRALLLFAIVLGMAALVASLSRPVDHRRDRSSPATKRPTTPPGGGPRATAPPGPEPGLPKTLSFAAAERQSRKLGAGDAATVEVAVAEAGTVDIPDMGLTAPADPVTPARFDVLATRPGRYRLVFMPAGRGDPTPVGTLVVTSRG